MWVGGHGYPHHLKELSLSRVHRHRAPGTAFRVPRVGALRSAAQRHRARIILVLGMACAGLLIAAPVALFLSGGGDGTASSRDPEGVFTGDPDARVGGGPGPSVPGVATESSQSPAPGLPPVDPAAGAPGGVGGGPVTGDGTGSSTTTGTGTGTGPAAVAGARPAPAGGGSNPAGAPSGGGTGPGTSPGGTQPGGTQPGGTQPGGTQPGGGTPPGGGGGQPQQPPADDDGCVCEVLDPVTGPVLDGVGKATGTVGGLLP